MPETSSAFSGTLTLATLAGGQISEARIRLLEAIARTGSIHRAAQEVPMAYKAAWEAVDSMNNLAPEAIVTRATGGRAGGGTQLTAYGQRLIAMYRALETETHAALSRLAPHLHREDLADAAAFSRLLRPVLFACSARNQFAGKVTALIDGGVDVEVRLAIAPGAEIVSVITHASMENLGLALGKEAIACIKASELIIGAGDAPTQLSARNVFQGEVCALLPGSRWNDPHAHASPASPVCHSLPPKGAMPALGLPGGGHDEIQLQLPAGRILTATVPARERAALALQEGSRAWACCKASSVLLMRAQ